VPDNFEIQQLTILNQNLNDLIDVNAPTPATNDILQFDGSNWVNVNTPTVSALSYYSLSATSSTASISTVVPGQQLRDSTGTAIAGIDNRYELFTTSS